MFASEVRKQKAIFAAIDTIALGAAFIMALRLHDPSRSMEGRLIESNPALIGVAVAALGALWITVFRSIDLYRIRNGGAKESWAIIKGCSISVLLTLLVIFFAHIKDVSREVVLLGYVFSIPLVHMGRVLSRACIRRFYANPRIEMPLIIVGFNRIAHYLLDQLLDEMSHYEPVGFLDDSAIGSQYRGYPVIGSLGRLTEFVELRDTIEVAIALADAPGGEQERIVRLCEQLRMRWWLVPGILCSSASALKVDVLGAVPLIGPRCSNIEGLNYAVKRMFDLVVASLLLIPVTFTIALGAILVWVADGPPVLFRQTRIGIHGRPFELLKLRTMRRSANDHVHREYVRNWIRDGCEAAIIVGANGDKRFKLASDNRITAVGKVLRRFSVDELPQLINVVRGDMSLIGPRPALPYEFDLYEGWHRRRLDAAPGITGLWQVSGRNRLSFEEMVRLDVQYLEEWSLVGDLKILMRTVPVLLRGDGA